MERIGAGGCGGRIFFGIHTSGFLTGGGGGATTPGFFAAYFGLKAGSATCSNVLTLCTGFVAGSGRHINTFRLNIYTFYKDSAFKLV
jgi:hypothetical protein